jgi:hypothetical protein
MSEERIPETVQIEKTKTYLRTSSNLGALEPVTMQTPRGPVHVEEAPGILTLEIDRAGAPHSIGVLVYEPLPGRGCGLIGQMDAKAARAVAASLMLMADRLEAVELNS